MKSILLVLVALTSSAIAQEKVTVRQEVTAACKISVVCCAAQTQMISQMFGSIPARGPLKEEKKPEIFQQAIEEWQKACALQTSGEPQDEFMKCCDEYFKSLCRVMPSLAYQKISLVQEPIPQPSDLVEICRINSTVCLAIEGLKLYLIGSSDSKLQGLKLILDARKPINRTKSDCDQVNSVLKAAENLIKSIESIEKK